MSYIRCSSLTRCYLNGIFIALTLAFRISVCNPLPMIVAPVLVVLELGESGGLTFSLDSSACILGVLLYLLDDSGMSDGAFLFMFLKTDSENWTFESLMV